MTAVKDFEGFRQRMDKRILESGNKVIKRVYSVDNLAYSDGALDIKVKEMLGLVASLVLRCDDCVKYHLRRCKEEGIVEEQLFEAMSVGLVVGGTIVIPHLRRAADYWDALHASEA